MSRWIVALSLLAALAAVVTTVTGLFWTTGAHPYELRSVHGQNVTLFGDGLYATESTFMAPILKGSDAAVLCVVLPLLLVTTFLGQIKAHQRARLVHIGASVLLTYYATSMTLGVSYNRLFPVYLVMFSASFFATVLSLIALSRWRPEPTLLRDIPQRGLVLFLGLAGCSLMVWLTEVIPAALTGTAPHLLGMNTTGVTYALDIGLIAPTCFLAAVLVWRRQTMGIVLAAMLLVANVVMAVMVLSQTLFQRAYGVEVSAQDLAIFVGVFVVIGSWAIVLLVKTLRCVEPGTRA